MSGPYAGFSNQPTPPGFNNQPAPPGFSSLPAGWNQVCDAVSGKDYYYHTDTKQTQWTRPQGGEKTEADATPGFGHQQGFSNQPASGFSNQPSPGFSNQPAPGFSNQPAPGFSNQPAPGFSNQPTPGLSNQPSSGFSNHPTPGLSNQPPRGFSNQPPRGFSNQPVSTHQGVMAALANPQPQQPPAMHSAHRERLRKAAERNLAYVLSLDTDGPGGGGTVQGTGYDAMASKRARDDYDESTVMGLGFSGAEGGAAGIVPGLLQNTVILPPKKKTMKDKVRDMEKGEFQQAKAMRTTNAVYIWGFPTVAISCSQVEGACNKFGVVKKIKFYRDTAGGGALKGDALAVYLTAPMAEKAITRLNGFEIQPNVRIQAKLADFSRAKDTPQQNGNVGQEGQSISTEDEFYERHPGNRLLNPMADIPSEVVILNNMFDPEKAAQQPPDFVTELENEVGVECQNFGVLLEVDALRDGSISVRYEKAEEATKCFQVMDGRFFDEGEIICEYDHPQEEISEYIEFLIEKNRLEQEKLQKEEEDLANKTEDEKLEWFLNQVGSD